MCADLLEKRAAQEEKAGGRESSEFLRDDGGKTLIPKTKGDEVEDNKVHDDQRVGSPTRDEAYCLHMVEEYLAHCRRVISGERVSSVMSNDQKNVPESKFEHKSVSELDSDSKIAEGKAP
jgi:hypothetical protein